MNNYLVQAFGAKIFKRGLTAAKWHEAFKDEAIFEGDHKVLILRIYEEDDYQF